MKHVLNIRKAIASHGISMKDVAERMGVSSASLSQKSNSIRTDTAMKIAEAIGCDLFELWETYDDDGILISVSELYPKRNVGTELDSQSTKYINPMNENNQSDLFHQLAEEAEHKENSNGENETRTGFLNNITTHKNENIAGYGRCPKCGARFTIILD